MQGVRFVSVGHKGDMQFFCLFFKVSCLTRTGPAFLQGVKVRNGTIRKAVERRRAKTVKNLRAKISQKKKCGTNGEKDRITGKVRKRQTICVTFTKRKNIKIIAKICRKRGCQIINLWYNKSKIYTDAKAAARLLPRGGDEPF